MPIDLSRRRFLQLSALGAGAVATSPMWSRLEAVAAPPLSPHDPILVLVMMTGGNDGLNTVVPIADSTYYGIRPTIAIPANQALHIDANTGLHPAFVKLKAQYDAGHVAIIRGVGYSPPDFSHFDSMAWWMQGWGGATMGSPTGWVGRYVDNFPNAATESLYSVTLGTNGVPLHLVGDVSRAASLPLSLGDRFGIDRSDPDDQRLFAAINSLAARGNTGLGQWGDLVANTNREVMQLTRRIAPAYTPQANGEDDFTRQMELVANLVNRNLGIRVFNVDIDGFDTHTGQVQQQQDLFTMLDSGIDKLFTTLSPSWADNVMMITFSEFGRRPEENDGQGTDHGSASVVFAVGPRVKGGLYGQQPSLSPGALVDYGNLQSYVDFHSVYATVLEKWLKADDKQVLGATYPQLGFVASTP